VKTEAHQQYKNGNFPGVTTVLNVLNKPGLPKWANKLGLKGIDSSKYTDETAEIGTLAHELIMCYFNAVKCETADYSANQIDQAKHSLKLFYQWDEIYRPDPILVETRLDSMRYHYGGTIDLYATLHIANQTSDQLVDFKTGSGPYPTHFCQLAAYKNLLIENGYPCEDARLLQIPARGKQQEFYEVQLSKLDKYWELFLHCLAIYRMKLL